MPTIHILSQFVWPDAAPTAIYAEQLGDELIGRGHDVRLVGTTGDYRSCQRPRPLVPVTRLAGYRSLRGKLAGVFLEYVSAYRLFANYIRREVAAGDVVVATSAPPTTPWLLRTIRRREARAVYWLQDYYPELVRSLWEYPVRARHAARARWDRALAGWDVVMKIGANLGYAGANSVVRRNWATFDFSADEMAPRSNGTRAALYNGNLGYAHDVDSFVRECARLREEGYHIIVRGDGPGIGQLPGWIDCGPAFADELSLRTALLAAEIHLLAAHPNFQEALFPSKLWNALATGRQIIGTGFAGVMERELHDSLASDHRRHRAEVADTVESFLT